MQLSPQLLYPTVSFSSINPKTIEKYVSLIEDDKVLPSIELIYFGGFYFILQGHHQMLAYNRLKKDVVEVIVLDYRNIPLWNTERKIIENLDSISVSTLYDFEGVGGFFYSKYPDYYRRDS